MVQYGFFFDNARCTGCKTCMMACKDYNDLNLETAFRKVYDYEGGTWKEEAGGTYSCDSWVYHVSLSCQHCENPACVANCPTTAMHKDKETGLVSVDATKCIGCGYCAMVCPYNEMPWLFGACRAGFEAYMRRGVSSSRHRVRYVRCLKKGSSRRGIGDCSHARSRYYQSAHSYQSLRCGEGARGYYGPRVQP